MADIFDLFRKIEKAPEAPAQPIAYLIVGLGNPGAKYTFTRHNAGFLALDYLSQKQSFKIDRSRFKALTGETVIAGKRCLVMKPQTYMNASGEAVREAMDFYKLTTDQLLVLSDDTNLEPGKLRIRRKGSDGGQKGLRSIIYHLNSDGFARIRLGVGAKPHPDYDMADWVLSEFSEADKKTFFSAVEKAYEGVELILAGQIDKAMNVCN